MIQVNNFIYLTLSTVHYFLLTQNIDFLSPYKEFFYNSELCFVALFFATEIYSYFKIFAEIVVLSITISAVLCIFFIITVYTTVEIYFNQFFYRDCDNPFLLASKILGLILVLVYIYLAIRITYILHSLKNILDRDKSKSNKNDLK